MSPLRFSFRKHAAKFDEHIYASIPGYDKLVRTCASVSRRWVQDHTNVVDAGCSTGRLIASVERENRGAKHDVNYHGIDIEVAFSQHWIEQASKNLSFAVCDVREHDYNNLSFAVASFIIQFLPENDKLLVLRKIHAGLAAGGAMIIAEKILANSARLQDALTFPYYDFKRSNGFTPRQILDKERALRGLMTLWTEEELKAALYETGFRELQPIWGSFPFVAYLALK